MVFKLSLVANFAFAERERLILSKPEFGITPSFCRDEAENLKFCSGVPPVKATVLVKVLPVS